MIRREFAKVVAGSLATVMGRPAWAQAPAILRSETSRPSIPHGVSSGDVDATAGVVWSRTDRPSRMVVEYSTRESFQDVNRVQGPLALPENDFTAKLLLEKLPPGQTIRYRVTFVDVSDRRSVSPPVEGQFTTPALGKTPIRFAWGGDTAGQGFGIDVARGGMLTYDSIRRARPQFFLHSGDHIYADNPIPAEIRLDDGSTWKNITTEATSKVAETLAEYRGRYQYNLIDDNFRRFAAEVPILAQWDDHEVVNNWYPGEMLEDPRYQVKSVDVLAARARQAFFDYIPTRLHPADPRRLYRSLRYGPSLEVFLLDQRSYRGKNSRNVQAKPGAETAFLGTDQVIWLAKALKASTATWKVIASDMPVGLVVRDGPTDFEALANADAGPPKGRELELADLLRTVQAAGVRNLVWLTADVHHAAALEYHPTRATFTEFDPFWEFVAGPLHAGTFGPSELDPTFGPEMKFSAVPKGLKPNRSPAEGLQFFGTLDIDPKDEAMTVALNDRNGKRLYSVDLHPRI